MSSHHYSSSRDEASSDRYMDEAQQAMQALSDDWTAHDDEMNMRHNRNQKQDARLMHPMMGASFDEEPTVHRFKVAEEEHIPVESTFGACSLLNGSCTGWGTPSEVVVKIMALSNPNLSQTRDATIEEIPLPNTPGFICVGRVMSQIPNTCKIQQNDRVMCILPDSQSTRFEMYSNVPYDSIFKISKDAEPYSQIALVLTYLPAIQCLQAAPFSVKNKKILVNGGVGPVSQALMCLARIHGAKKVYVPVAKNHREFIRYLGAKTLGPSHKDWGQSMMGELDLVIDALGENNYVTSKAAIKKHGHLVVIGCSSVSAEDDSGGMMTSLSQKFVEMRLKSSTRTTIYSLLNSWENERDSFIQDYEYLSGLMVSGEITPIAKRVALDDYRDSKIESSSEGVPICDIQMDE